MKVYAVHEGDYEDRYIVGLFSTPEKAERIRKLMDLSDPVKEMEIDPNLGYPDGLFYYRVSFVRDEPILAVDIYPVEKDSEPDVMNGCMRGSHGELGRDCVFHFLWAKDENEARQQNKLQREILNADCWASPFQIKSDLHFVRPTAL